MIQSVPLFEHTLPGRSGDAVDHLIPAVMILAFSSLYLIVTWVRAMHLPEGSSFAETHIPEKNRDLVFWLGLAATIGTGIGCSIEAIGGMIHSNYNPLTHETVYLCYTIVGIVAMLESKERLPPDSHRRFLALNLALQCLLWLDHGLNHTTPTDSKMHILLALVDLIGCLVVAYSVYDPCSVEAFLASLACIFAQGTWLATVAMYIGFVDIAEERVCTYLALQILGIALVMVLATAVVVTQKDSNQYKSIPGIACLDTSSRSQKDEIADCDPTAFLA